MVTHDQEEALTLADTIAVMSQGRVEQVGTPEQIYREPASRFVAEFVGVANWLPVQRRADGVIELAGQRLDADVAEALLPRGSRGELFCRPEDVSLVDEGWTPEQMPLLATLQRVDFMGGLRRLHLSLVAAPQVTLVADLGAHDAWCERLVQGQRLSLQLRADRLRCFGPELGATNMAKD